MRVLIVTNMYPTRERPEFGVFVRDQLEALSRLDGLDVELFAFPPGARSYPRAARRLRRHLQSRHYDVVHAHYGLTGWVAHVAKAHPLVVTFHGTDLKHPKVGPWSRRLAARIDQVAVVSAELGKELAGIKLKRPAALLPVGINLDRVQPEPRARARAALDLDPAKRYVLFPADPARPEKRHDRAAVLLREFPEVELLTLGGVRPSQVGTWYSAVDAVLIPSDYEGFGLAVLEALSCDVPVIATPTGIAPEATAGIAGTHCEPFDLGRWRELLAGILADPEPSVRGAARADNYSTDTMAARVVQIYDAIARG